MRILRHFPEIVNDYELNPERGALSVIVPRAARNLIENPDMELGRLCWAAASTGPSYVQLDPVDPYRGAYSLRAHSASPASTVPLVRTVPSNFGTAFFTGVEQTIPVVAGRAYTLQFWYKASLADQSERLYVTSSGTVTGSAALPSLAYRLDDRPITNLPQTTAWRRAVVTWRESTTQTRQLIIGASASMLSGTIWLDDVQLEEGDRASTLISGGLTGAGIEDGDYTWTGAPGASPSIRSSGAPSGGDVVNLSDFGFQLSATVGLGLNGYRNVIQPSSTGGGHYSETIVDGSTFQVVGRIEATGPLDLSAKRAALINALRHDRASGRSRPVVLRYQLFDGCDAMTDPVDIVAVYQGGLEGQVDNLFAEHVAISFAHYRRDMVVERQAGAALPTIEDYRNASHFLHDVENDAYSFPGISNVGAINVIRARGGGRFLIGGPFTNAGGVAAANAVMLYNPSTGAINGWGAATTSGVGVDGITITSQGEAIAFGQFTQLGGLSVVNAARLYADNSVWQYFGAPNARVRAVIETPGRLYAFGDFTLIGAAASTGGAYTTDRGGSWTALTFPIGTVTSVRAAAYDPRTNRLYFSALTASQSYVGYFDLTAGTSTAVVFAPSTSVVYVGIYVTDEGVFLVRSSTAGGTTSGIVRYVGGTSIVPVAEYPAAYLGGVNRTWQDSAGAIHIATLSTQKLGGITSPAQYHRFDGARVLPSPVLCGGDWNYPVTAFDQFGPWRMFGFGTGVWIGTPGAKTIEDVGTSVPAVLTFQGPGQLAAIENMTTGQRLDFSLRVRVNEVITVDTRTGRVTSSTRGTSREGVLSQSSIATWRLAPGANRIRVSFWPIANNAAPAEYTAVLTGTANSPGTGFIKNASRANTNNGWVAWDVTTTDIGTLWDVYFTGKRFAVTSAGSSTLTPSGDMAEQLSGHMDFVPTPGPATGVVWYPLVHLYYDNMVASIDAVAER